MRKIRLFRKIDENINRIVYWVAFLSLGSAAMSWPATYITPLYQYGWGAVVFAGVGVACAIVLVISSALVAWRYYHPLPKQPTTPSEGQEAPSALDNVLNRRLVEIEQGITQNKANIEQLRIDFEELKARVTSDRKRADSDYSILSTSLRARDAENKVKEADQVIMTISKRLLNESYSDESAWAADYAAWEAAIKRIDGIMSEWVPQQHHKPFLDIRLRDFELGAPAPPPESNIKSDANVMHYKTVWLAQRNYANRRDNIFIFFTSKTGELPNLQ